MCDISKLIEIEPCTDYGISDNPEILWKDELNKVFHNFISLIKRYRIYDISKKKYFA